MLEITIPMRPVSKARPRFVNGRAYTDQKTKLAEDAVSLAVHHHMLQRDIKISNKPISIELEFAFKLPANMTKAEKELLKNNQFHCIKRVDLDNMVKLVADSLNKVAYNDDKQIVHLEAYKIFGEEDYIKIKIEEIK